MTIREAFKCRVIEYPEKHKPMYDIDFYNDGEIDETQFTVNSISTAEEELIAFFKEFCKENSFKTNSVISITSVVPD